jgi:hypothetical protein
MSVQAHVRSTPESGRQLGIAQCPQSATFDHVAAQQNWTLWGCAGAAASMKFNSSNFIGETPWVRLLTAGGEVTTIDRADAHPTILSVGFFKPARTRRYDPANT